MNPIVFAAYWNEIDWVVPSLEQLDLLQPIEAIICEGCFDPKFPLHSTDGTLEIIQRYVSERSFAKLISPVRRSLWSSLIETWQGHSRISRAHRVLPARVRTALATFHRAAYRRNQALTFNSMISRSQQWAPGRWFMTYDADQFYSDPMLEAFVGHVDGPEVSLLTGTELTFMDGFETYTLDYEKRTFNNMPHQVFASTIVIPTRRIVLEGPLERSLYVDKVETKSVGTYFHYRFRSPSREHLTYAVGDRISPPRVRMQFHLFDREHPSLIRRHFGL